MRYISFIAAALLLLAPFEAWAATPTVVGSCSSQFNDSSSGGNSYSFTVTGGTQNSALIVFEGTAGAGSNVTGITYPRGGSATAMTQLTFLTNVYISDGVSYFLSNPDVGTANVITTLSPNTSEFVIICQLQDVVQSSPQDVAAVQTSGTGVSSLSQNITTATDNDLLIGWAGNGGPATSLTAGGSATQIANFVANTRKIFAETLPLAAHGTQAMSYSWTTNANADFYVMALKYQAPAAAAAAVAPRQNAVFMF